MHEAEELIAQYMAGVPYSQRPYTFLGQLSMALNQKMPFAMGGRSESPKPEKYRMDLDLMTGILEIDHKLEGVSYHREMFISNPAGVLWHPTYIRCFSGNPSGIETGSCRCIRCVY